MNNYLLQYAIDNVWRSPTRDRQFVYELKRISPPLGIRQYWEVDFQLYQLPDTTSNWHIYQIGLTVPINLNLTNDSSRWYSFTEWGNTSGNIASLYDTAGIQYPRFESYFMVTFNKNLVIAIRSNPRLPDLDITQVYLHLYSNAYLKSPQASSLGKNWIYLDGIRPKTNQELVNFQIKVQDFLNANPYPVQYFVNGRWAERLDLTTAMVEDTIDVVVDPSIKKVVDFSINELRPFDSSLDHERKFILHYPESNGGVIDYYDDLDLYLYKPKNNQRSMGVYYHHNEGTWLRQLTHKDYSISSRRLSEFVVIHPEDPRHAINPGLWDSDKWESIEDLRLKLYIRETDRMNPIPPDANRIKELYKLDSSDILDAMTGVDSIDVWRAENLERTQYVQFMSLRPEVVYPEGYNENVPTEQKREITERAGDVFGYLGTGYVIANSPQPVVNGSVLLPSNYWDSVTVFEYDELGKLLGYQYQVNNPQYTPVNPQCSQVECVYGIGGLDSNGVYGNQPVVIPNDLDHRIYVCGVRLNNPTDEWVDITNADNRAEYGHYEITNGVTRWVWDVPTYEYYGCIKFADRFYLESFTFNKSTGIIRFDMGNNETRNGVTNYRDQSIPYGDIEVFLNGRSLIYDLDYCIDFPSIVLNNLEYLTDDIQEILVRGSGFCNPDLTVVKPSEIGFVEYDVISNDGIYEIHQDKVQRIVVDGYYRDPKNLVFEEDRLPYGGTNVRNGAPYQISNPFIPLMGVFANDQLKRNEDLLRQKQVEDFLTVKLPQRERPYVDLIKERYVVYSVYANKVLHDIRQGIIEVPNGRYTMQDLERIMRGYQWLADLDIVNRGYNENHVDVWPHWWPEPVPVTIYQYNFYQDVLKRYLRTPVDLSPFIYVGPYNGI